MELPISMILKEAKVPLTLERLTIGFIFSSQGQPDLFPEASLYNDLNYGKNRAKCLGM